MATPWSSVLQYRHNAIIAGEVNCLSVSFLVALDLCSLAFGAFGLLHLPKMPELKGKDTSSFSPYPISVEDIPYKDKSKQRQEEKLKLKKGNKL